MPVFSNIKKYTPVNCPFLVTGKHDSYCTQRAKNYSHFAHRLILTQRSPCHIVVTFKYKIEVYVMSIMRATMLRTVNCSSLFLHFLSLTSNSQLSCNQAIYKCVCVAQCPTLPHFIYFFLNTTLPPTPYFLSVQL